MTYAGHSRRGLRIDGPSVLRPDRALTHPYTLHRADVIEPDGTTASPRRSVSIAASRARGERRRNSASPRPRVLAEFGYSKGEIDALVAKGVVCGGERER